MLEITKETCEKCGIKTIEYHDKEKDIIELWQKMSNVEKQQIIQILQMLHLRESENIVVKNQKKLQKKKNKNIKYIFKVKQIYFIIENLARDIIEPCKIPDTTKLKKN